MKAGRFTWAGCMVLAIGLAQPFPAAAETLRDALSSAYANSPLIAQRRHEVDVIAEDRTDAAAPGRPTVLMTGTHNEAVKAAIPSIFLPDRTLRGAIALRVPILRSGTVVNSVRDAEERYRSSSRAFDVSSANFLGQVAVIYFDVIRDQKLVELGDVDVAALRANLRMVKGRFEIGDLTASDVAQSEARLATSIERLLAARSQLQASAQDYIRFVGHAPQGLQPDLPVATAPVPLDTAIDTAVRDNPALAALKHKVAATEYRIRAAHGERGPRLTATASTDYFDYLDSLSKKLMFKLTTHGTAANLGLSLELPLYQGGLPASHVRRARAEKWAALDESRDARQSIEAQVRATHEAVNLLRERLDIARSAVTRNEAAVNYLRRENEVGTRSLIDVLNARRDLTDSQAELVSIEHDLCVAQFALQILMGKVGPTQLGLSPQAIERAYGPERPRQSWSDWADGRAADRD